MSLTIIVNTFIYLVSFLFANDVSSEELQKLVLEGKCVEVLNVDLAISSDTWLVSLDCGEGKTGTLPEELYRRLKKQRSDLSLEESLEDALTSSVKMPTIIEQSIQAPIAGCEQDIEPPDSNDPCDVLDGGLIELSQYNVSSSCLSRRTSQNARFFDQQEKMKQCLDNLLDKITESGRLLRGNGAHTKQVRSRRTGNLVRVARDPWKRAHRKIYDYLYRLKPQEQDFLAMVLTTYGEIRGHSDRETLAIMEVIKNRRDAARDEDGCSAANYLDVSLQRKQFSMWNDNDPNWIRVLRADSSTLCGHINLYAAFASNSHQKGIVRDDVYHYHAKSMSSYPNWARTNMSVNYAELFNGNGRRGRVMHVFYRDIPWEFGFHDRRPRGEGEDACY